MKKYTFIILILLSWCIFSQNYAQAVRIEEPQPVLIPKDQITSLDLSYVYGGDYIMGKWLWEEELIQIISTHPNLIELDISGQTLSVNVMSAIHDHLPTLRKLIIRGNVRFNNGDGLYYSSESLNQKELFPQLFEPLFKEDSPIEILDLSLNIIDDEGLEMIAKSTSNLKEIYLEGVANITDSGILILVNSQPNLTLIDLSRFTLRRPLDGLETIAPGISEAMVDYLLTRGITVVQNHRMPWF